MHVVTYVLFNTEEEIWLVLFRDGGQVHGQAGKVDSLPRAQGASVLDLADQVLAGDLLADDGDEAVIDEDAVSSLHHVGDVLVVHPHDGGGALLHERLVGGQLDGVIALQLYLSWATLEMIICLLDRRKKDSTSQDSNSDKYLVSLSFYSMV